MQDNPDLAEGGADKGALRAAPSLNKRGEMAASDEASDRESDPEFVGATGMGWFPGYAICTETGERLNMAFGEDSWLANENGADMIVLGTHGRAGLGRMLMGSVAEHVVRHAKCPVTTVRQSKQS